MTIVTDICSTNWLWTRMNRVAQVKQQLPVTSYLDYRSWLGDLYKEAKRLDPGYSYLKFSQDLGVGASNAHHLVSGRRELTVKACQKICQKIDLRGVHKKFFILLVRYSRTELPVDRDALFREIIDLKSKTIESETSRHQLQYYTEWYNVAILEMLGMENASDDPAWIAAHLVPKVSLPNVRKSLELLSELGYLKYSAKHQRLFPAAVNITADEETSAIGLVRFHQQMIELGKSAITEFNHSQREISAITAPLTPGQFEEIRSEIVALRKRIVSLSNNAQDPDKVIQVKFQMFPVVKDLQGDDDS